MTEEKAINKSNKFDLGSKNVKKTFLTILIPSVIAQLIAGTYVIFDTFFVSHGFQPSAVFGGALDNFGDVSFNNEYSSYASLGPAAMSYAMPYTFFIVGMGLAVGGGLSAIMTKQLAKDDSVGAQRTMNSFLPMSVFWGFVMMIFLLIFAKFLVWMGSGFQKDYLEAWFNNPLWNPDWDVSADNITDATYDMVNGHILQQASLYLRIQAIGAIPYVYMSSGVIMLRVQGKAQYATVITLVGLGINVTLDFILIIVMKMNIVGAAIASVTGQLASALLYYIYFKFYAAIKATSFDVRNTKDIMSKTFVSGISMMMLQVNTGIMIIFFTFTIGIANYGDMYAVTNYTAVYQGYNSIFMFGTLIIIAIAQSMKPIVEYNYVKGDVENVNAAKRIGFGIGIPFSIIMVIIFEIFAKDLIGIFYSVDGSTVDFITTSYFINTGALNTGDLIYTNGMDVAQTITRIMFLTFPLAVGIQLTATYIQGLGQDSKASILLFGKLFLLLPLLMFFGFALPHAIQGEWGYYSDPSGSSPISSDIISPQADLGIFLSLPVTDIIMTSLTIYFFVGAEKNIIRPMKKNT